MPQQDQDFSQFDEATDDDARGGWDQFVEVSDAEAQRLFEQAMTAMRGDPSSQPVPGEFNFTGPAANQFMNNMLALPQVVGEIGALGNAAISKVGSAVFGENRPFSEIHNEIRENPLMSPLLALPQVTTQDIRAGVRSIPSLLPFGESPGEAFNRHSSVIALQDARDEALYPWSSAAGRVAGDVLSLGGVRAPFARTLGRAESRLSREKPDLFFGGAASAAQETNMQYVLNRTLLSRPMMRLARGAGRAAETGFEAMVLDIMHGDDPFETAAYAAAGQAAGSVFLESGKGLLSGGLSSSGIKIGMAALAIGSMWQIFESAAPGYEKGLLPSFESGYDKVTLSLALGALSGLAGAGRLRGSEIADRFPIMADALTAIPRAGMISIMEDFVDSTSETKERAQAVINKLMADPEFFGEETAQELARSIQSGNLMQAIEDLYEDDEFRQKMFGDRPPQMGQ